jgi:MFS family permease
LAGLLAGHVVSLTGNMLTLIALPLYVLAETGSAAATGVAGFFATLPVVIGGPFGGVLVDRVGYRRASVVADAVSGVTIATVPLIDVAVGLPFWALIGLVFASGLLDTPGQTARSALLPDVAATARVPLERAVGMFEATERAARLVGAPVAGFLVALLGPLTVLAVDAATFAVSAALIATLVPRPAGRAPTRRSEHDSSGTAELPPGGYWRELGEGLRFTAREPLLRALVLLVLVTNLFDAAKFSVLLPVYAQRQLGGAVALGLLVGTMGGGALVGSLTFGAIGHRLPRRATFVTAFALAGGPPFLALAAGLPLSALLPITALAGFAAGAINPIIGTVKLERVPAGMRARVYGLVNAGAWAAMPLGALGAGFAAEQFGVTATLFALGCAYILVTLTPLLGGPWRDMNRHPA